MRGTPMSITKRLPWGASKWRGPQLFGPRLPVGSERQTGPCEEKNQGDFRVLVIDDDQDTADSLSMLVRLWGHEVDAAYGGAEGFDIALRCLPDVLLVDVAM